MIFIKRILAFLVLIYTIGNFQIINAQAGNRVLVLFEADGKYGFKDSATNEIVIPATYQNRARFRDGIAVVKLNDKSGCITENGEIIVPIKYDFIFSFQEGLAWVKKDNKFGFVDKTGQEVIPLIYDRAYGFQEGLACVKLNNKWGFIDKSGKEVIPIKYDGIQHGFNEGLAYVNVSGKGDIKGGKFGFVDKQGIEIIPLKYDKVSGFRNDSALVQINKKKFWINKKGERLR